MEEEKCPHAVYQRPAGKGRAAVLLPAPATGQPHPGCGLLNTTGQARTWNSHTDLGRAVLWDPGHHQGDLHHFTISQFSFHCTGICLECGSAGSEAVSVLTSALAMG